jgi:hypothetical protein
VVTDEGNQLTPAASSTASTGFWLGLTRWLPLLQPRNVALLPILLPGGDRHRRPGRRTAMKGYVARKGIRWYAIIYRRGLISRNVALVAHAPSLRSIPRVDQASWTAEGTPGVPASRCRAPVVFGLLGGGVHRHAPGRAPRTQVVGLRRAGGHPLHQPRADRHRLPAARDPWQDTQRPPPHRPRSDHGDGPRRRAELATGRAACRRHPGEGVDVPQRQGRTDPPPRHLAATPPRASRSTPTSTSCPACRPRPPASSSSSSRSGGDQMTRCRRTRRKPGRSAGRSRPDDGGSPGHRCSGLGFFVAGTGFEPVTSGL